MLLMEYVAVNLSLQTSRMCLVDSPEITSKPSAKDDILYQVPGANDIYRVHFLSV